MFVIPYCVELSMGNTIQRGFTLIELMIVIAIVGILASIAMPSYRDYVRKARMTDVISQGNSFATKAIEYYNTNGAWPGLNSGTMDDLVGTDDQYSFANGDNILRMVIHNYNGNGQVFFHVTGESFGNGSDDWIRLNLIDDGSIIRKEWCDTGGHEPTNPNAYPYLPC